MTQEQHEFTESLEVALSWMQAIQEKLKANDNTQGPRDALEARLRETEKIHQSQHEGRVKMDMALVAAENLLQSGDEELRNHTHTKLKDLKSLWEETCTYIIHCHSRIEWVWLHWSEYLKAYEEFELWLTRQQRSLDVGVELQLGLKEKLWHVDQQRVVVSDIHSQAALLERLLDEAAALHNRTQDPSVEPQAQETLQEAYNDIRDRAEERLSLLQKIAEEHQTYQGCVQRFQSWLLSKTKELTYLMEREDLAENKLKALQALDDSVASEEKTLQHIENMAESVRANTSPAGAEVVVEEAEELRLGWQRLRQGLCEAEDGLRSSLDSHSQYMTRCQRLGEDIGRLRVLLQGLEQELVKDHADCTEDQIEGQWKKYTGVRNTLTEEESQVEHLKAQLKELFRFSEDSRHMSDDVLAVVKEHQSVKCRVTRLCSESESGLRNILQDPLLVYTHWSHVVAQVLEASAEVTDFSHIAMLVQNIESLLKDSVQLQERFSLLQVRGDLLDSVFGPERSDDLQGELSSAMRNRELLHTQLLQRKSRLQALISRTKDFGDAYKLIHSKLAALQNRLVAADGLQPDILAKKSQSDQFRVIQKDLEECEAHIIALETLVSSSQNNRTQFEKLYADWRSLHKAVRRALGEFPEKELQLQQMDVQGQEVLERTSEEGKVHIIRDINRLHESWWALYNMSLNLHRLLNSSTELNAGKAFQGSRKQGSQRKDQTGEVNVTRPGGEVHQEVEAAEGGVTRQGGWIQGHADFSKVSKDSTTDGIPDSDNSTGGDNSILAPARGRKELTTKVNYSEESTRSSADISVEAGESLNHGGGAFSLFRRDPAKQPSTAPTQDTLWSSGQYESRRREFEAWLCRENELLAGILRFRGSAHTAEELKTRQETLKALRARLPWGQEHFQLLLQESQGSEAGSGPAEDVGLEELRYRWMLYKSKLKDIGDIRARLSAKRVQDKQDEPAPEAKVQKKSGLLQRACRLALPLWLFLLALLLLAFLLPFMDEDSSCSLSNNFARSFNIMLRYDGPPPT